MGVADRVIRLSTAIALVALFFSITLKGIPEVVGLTIAGIFTLTSLLSFCPLITLFGVSSCSNAEGINENR